LTLRTLQDSQERDVQRTVDMFVKDVKQKPIPRREAGKRMLDKPERRGFQADVLPLVTAEERARFDEATGRRAFQEVFEGLISWMPGKSWATTPELRKKHRLRGGPPNVTQHVS
jgi:hypothetical protein